MLPFCREEHICPRATKPMKLPWPCYKYSLPRYFLNRLTCTSESASTCWSWNQVSLLWYFCRSSFCIATFPEINQKQSLRHAVAPPRYISIKTKLQNNDLGPVLFKKGFRAKEDFLGEYFFTQYIMMSTILMDCTILMSIFFHSILWMTWKFLKSYSPNRVKHWTLRTSL